MSEHGLLPCPCCGGRAIFLTRPTGFGSGESYDETGVRCVDCHLGIFHTSYSGYETRERQTKAAATWNTRPEQTP